MYEIFGAKKLATHTLSGRQTAQSIRPVTYQLDPVKIKDIIDTVVQYSVIHPKLVRNAVTAVCHQEAIKHFRNRRRNRSQDENIEQHDNSSNSTIILINK